MSYSLQSLGAVIKERRIACELTQDDLGSRAGYQAGAGVSISRIESGLTRPGPERLERLAAALSVTVDQLESDAETRVDDTPGSKAGTERSKNRFERIQREVERRESVTGGLYAAFDEAHERAVGAFYMPFVEIVGRIDGAPQPKEDALGGDQTTDPGAVATSRLRLSSRGVAHVLAGGVSAAAVGAAPEVGRVAAYGAFRTVVAYGTASTGKAVSDLWGRPQRDAALAILGGGTLANGGVGVAGGMRRLTGIRKGTALLLQIGVLAFTVRRNVKQQLALDAQLEEIDADLRATRRSFEALEDIVPRATQMLDDIAVHGGRALGKWAALVGQGPLAWDSLDRESKQRCEEFAEIAACQLSVASLNFAELTERSGGDREWLIEMADRVLTRSQEIVEALI